MNRLVSARREPAVGGGRAAGRGREAVHPLLVDLDPVAPAEVRAGGGPHRVEPVEHRRRHQGCCEDDGHDLAGHVRRVVAGQEHDDVGHLPRLGVAAEGLALGQLGQQLVAW